MGSSRRVAGLGLIVAAALIQLAVSAAAVAGPVPAFPGAEGFGASTPGGRGGRVLTVTNLGASGPGSLQWAAGQEGPRIVVFRVGGVIRGDVAIKHPFITIAGQTAPAPGITIEGRLLARPVSDERLHDVIVRYLRVRPRRATGFGGDAVQIPKSDRVILDHLSLSWANDEVVDIIHSSDVTLQWCTLEESDTKGHGKAERHNFGMIATYPGSGNISVHHNLFAHHSRRSPSLTPYEPGKPADFRNNVVYDFAVGLTHDGHVPGAGINFVANYYKRGPSAWKVEPYQFRPEGQYYLSGNVISGGGAIAVGEGERVERPWWLRVRERGTMASHPFPVAPVETDDARTAYRRVLEAAGAWPRDRVTARTIEEVRNATGRWGRMAPLAPEDDWFLAGLDRGSPPKDTDGDGMPDDWEVARGLDPAVRDDGRYLGDYTAIEVYTHARAADLLRQRRTAAPGPDSRMRRHGPDD